MKNKKHFSYTLPLDLKLYSLGIASWLIIYHFLFKHKTINKIQCEPVQFWFAVDLEIVVFVHGGTEDQVKLQGFLWEQSAKSIIGLDVYTLQFAKDNTA